MLRSLDAIRVDGAWRLASNDYSRLFIKHLLASINSLEVSQINTAISMSLILAQFADHNTLFPAKIVSQLLEQYKDIPVSSATDLEDPMDHDLFKLNITKICQFYALLLLPPTDPTLQKSPKQLSTFMIEWQQALIDDGCEATPTVTMLRGIAIVDPAPISLGGGRVYRFEARDLPITGDPAPILMRLFAVRPRWELASMEPYLKSVAHLSGSKTKVADLIIKHARISVDPVTGNKIVTPLINAL